MLAGARAFVFCFNTERNAVYCVLYVFLFILYNTVFFIVEPWAVTLASILRSVESSFPDHSFAGFWLHRELTPLVGGVSSRWARNIRCVASCFQVQSCISTDYSGSGLPLSHAI